MNDWTMDDAYRGWIASKSYLKDITRYKYMYLYEHFIRPVFGDRSLESLSRRELSEYYAYLADKRGLKAGTVRNYHNIIRQILQYAVQKEELARNPADKAYEGSDKNRWRTTSKKRAFTEEEQASLLAFLEQDAAWQRWYPTVRTLLGTGLRVGEFTGLRWEDVDLDKRTIAVRHSLGRVFEKVAGADGKEEYHYRSYMGTPKTAESQRVIPMLDSVRDALLQERAWQQERGIRCRAVVDGYTDFIFLNSAGGIQTVDALNKAFDRIREAHNAQPGRQPLPHFSCHTMRHTFATRLCEKNANLKAIQALLGHADIRITMNIYAEATEMHKKKEMEKLEKMFQQAIVTEEGQ